MEPAPAGGGASSSIASSAPPTETIAATDASLAESMGEPTVADLVLDVARRTIRRQRKVRPKPSRKELARERDEQNNRWRRVLFFTTITVVVLCVAASVGGGFLYLFHMHSLGKESSAAVLSTWFGANVVQVVGVLLVITRHLFPGSEQGERPKHHLTVSVE